MAVFSFTLLLFLSNNVLFTFGYNFISVLLLFVFFTVRFLYCSSSHLSHFVYELRKYIKTSAEFNVNQVCLLQEKTRSMNINIAHQHRHKHQTITTCVCVNVHCLRNCHTLFPFDLCRKIVRRQLTNQIRFYWFVRDSYTSIELTKPNAKYGLCCIAFRLATGNWLRLLLIRHMNNWYRFRWPCVN